MSIKGELRSKLKWYERSDALHEDDMRIARLAFEVAPQEYTDLGYVAQHNGKYYWAVVSPKLPGKTSIAAPTRSSEKCCKQLEKFVLSCLARAFLASKPLTQIEKYPLSIADYVHELVCRDGSDLSFESGFEYGVAYALRRLGIKELPPDWAAWASQDSSGRITYHEDKPSPNASYGVHESSKQTVRAQVGSTFNWMYSLKRIK